MSVKSNPGSGYVKELSVLIEAIGKQLPASEREAFSRAMEEADGDVDEMRELLTKRMEALNLPAPESIFKLGDEDDSDGEMQHDTWYVFFAESDLYKQVPTPALQRLNQLDIDPEHHTWATWG